MCRRAQFVPFALLQSLLLFGVLYVAHSETQLAPPEKSHQLAIHVIDSSPTESPLQASGQVQFDEEIAEDNVRTGYTLDVKLKNVSTKSVLAFEVLLDIFSDHGTGFKLDHDFDSYFREEAMLAPGAEYLLQEKPNHWAISPFVAVASPTKAQADVKVVFVEFADGSKFGDGKFAENLAAERRATVDGLNELDQAYHNGGAVNLLPVITEGLARPANPPAAMIILRQIKSIMDTQGPEAAEAKIHSLLNTANQRQFFN